MESPGAPVRADQVSPGDMDLVPSSPLGADFAHRVTVRLAHSRSVVLERLSAHSLLRMLIHLTVFAVLASSLFYLWQEHPKTLAAWSEKGTLFDLIGPAVLLVGSIGSLLLARYRRVHHLANPWAWLAYAGVLWLLMMEEIGWGFEMLPLARPEVGGIPVDSAHDLLRLARRVSIRDLISIVQLGAAALVLGSLLLIATRTGRRLLRKVSPSILVLLLLATGSLFFAAIFDARVVDIFWFLRRNPAYELEEVLELLGEVMLVLVVVDGWLSLPLARSVRSASPSAYVGALSVSRENPRAAGAEPPLL